jgi:integrase/recombinase XerD
LTAGEVTAFVLALSRRQRGSLARTVTALRSLLRFLHVEGVTGAGLADAVPTVARWKLAGLPKALTGDQVAALLASCDRGTVVGRRDVAILTVLSRLGLRAGEVARLRLEDIDWRRGEITVTGKGGRHERLPLPADVGGAIVSYLTDGRPDADVREVFTCVRAPHRPMGRGAVTNVVARAASRVHLPKRPPGGTLQWPCAIGLIRLAGHTQIKLQRIAADRTRILPLLAASRP